MYKQKANLQAKSLFANTEISPFPGFLGCQSPLHCKGSECHHFRCFIQDRGPREKQGYKITRRPVFENVQELDQPSFWVLKLEPKPHHQKAIQKMLSLERDTGHKQQVDTLPPQHKSFGNERAQALHPASVQGLKLSRGPTTNKQLPLPKPTGSFKRLLLNLHFYSAHC